jgi:hypothetical protein
MTSKKVYRENEQMQFDRFLETLEKLGREDLARDPDRGLADIVLISNQQQQQLDTQGSNRNRRMIAGRF